MTGITQPPGHGGEYVTDYGKGGEPVYKADPYPEDGPIGGSSPDQILHRPQPGGGPPPIASPDWFAIASLFLALVWLGGLGSLLAVVFGHTSRGRAKRNGMEPSGFATAGTVLGWVGIAVAVLVIPMAIV